MDTPPDTQEVRKRKGACTLCNKRMGSVKMRCKYCEYDFCMSCRYPETHKCLNIGAMRLEKTTTLQNRLEAERCVSSKIIRI